MLRRSFVAGLTALIAAPSLARSESLMVSPRRPFMHPWRDDTALLQAMMDQAAATGASIVVPPRWYRVDGVLVPPSGTRMIGYGSSFNRLATVDDPMMLLEGSGPRTFEGLHLVNRASRAVCVEFNFSYGDRVDFLDRRDKFHVNVISD
jgi:hypothetical protein